MSPVRILDIRPSASLRGYDARWRRARFAFLREQPFCRLCAQVGCVTRATVVDHIVRHSGPGDPLLWDPDNLQPLCKLCHDGAKHSQDMTGVLRGCDEAGVPLDPNHRWRT